MYYKNQHGNVYAIFGSVEIMVLREEAPNILQKPTREDYATRWFDRNYDFESRGPKYITKTNTGSLRNDCAHPRNRSPHGGAKTIIEEKKGNIEGNVYKATS